MISVYDLFKYQVTYVPHKTAIIHKDRQITYAELSDRICRLAAGMRSIGVKKGSHIGYLFHNCIECVEIFYAAQKLGAVAIPFNFRLIGPETGKLIDLVDADYFIFGPRHREVMEAAEAYFDREVVRIFKGEGRKENELDYDDLFHRGAEDSFASEPAGKETAMMMFTGGTTGLPKAAMLSGEAIFLKAIMHLTDFNDFSRDSVMMCYSPLFHIAGATYMMYLLSLGGTLLLAGTFDADLTLDQVEKYKITHIFLIPPNLCSLLKNSANYGKRDLSSIRDVVMSGAKNYPDLVREVFDTFPNAHVSIPYGHTESVADTIIFLDREEFEKNPGLAESVGRVTKGSEIQLRDADGNEVPPGVPGFAWSRNPAAMTGFYKMEDVFVDGWYDTGDILMKDEDGIFYFLDRAKDMVKSGGENVYCVEVETIIRQHKAVNECAVFGVPDAVYAEAVTAAVTLNPGFNLTEDELIAFCRENMASYKKPRKVYFVKDFPRTTTGKVDKVALREMFSK